MQQLAGVDGCRGGWLCVFWTGSADDTPETVILPDFASLIARHGGVIAIDMPIGLPERAESGGRAADREARTRLKGRQSSVFSVPARAAIACADYRDACAANLANSDPPRRIARQSFHLFPKIRDIDAVMTPELQDRVCEVHPELAFWAMNGMAALELPKKVKGTPYPPGMALRRGLLAAAGFPIERLAPPAAPKRQWGEDDLLDAAACAWSARRIAEGSAIRLPADPPRDPKGLRMEIRA